MTPFKQRRLWALLGMVMLFYAVPTTANVLLFHSPTIGLTVNLCVATIFAAMTYMLWKKLKTLKDLPKDRYTLNFEPKTVVTVMGIASMAMYASAVSIFFHLGLATQLALITAIPLLVALISGNLPLLSRRKSDWRNR